MIRLVPEFLKYLLHTLLTVLPIIVIKVLRILFFLTNGKKGKVAPLHKTGPKDDVNNYRPISVLPGLSKTLEKQVHEFPGCL